MGFDARHYGAVVCGGGPAATGMLVCAAQDDRLDELLEHGVVVIEQERVTRYGQHRPLPDRR